MELLELGRQSDRMAAMLDSITAGSATWLGPVGWLGNDNNNRNAPGAPVAQDNAWRGGKLRWRWQQISG